VRKTEWMRRREETREAWCHWYYKVWYFLALRRISCCCGLCSAITQCSDSFSTVIIMFFTQVRLNLLMKTNLIFLLIFWDYKFGPVWQSDRKRGRWRGKRMGYLTCLWTGCRDSGRACHQYITVWQKCKPN